MTKRYKTQQPHSKGPGNEVENTTDQMIANDSQFRIRPNRFYLALESVGGMEDFALK